MIRKWNKETASFSSQTKWWPINVWIISVFFSCQLLLKVWMISRHYNKWKKLQIGICRHFSGNIENLPDHESQNTESITRKLLCITSKTQLHQNVINIMHQRTKLSRFLTVHIYKKSSASLSFELSRSNSEIFLCALF